MNLRTPPVHFDDEPDEQQTRAAQLDRIATMAPPPPEDAVKIYKLTKGVDIWMWLCRPCLGERLAKGWSHMETRPLPFPRPCQDCTWKKEHP